MKTPDSDRSRFRWLLRMYPPAYLERYGRELEGLLAREWSEKRGVGSFWLRQLWDHGRAAAAVRRRDREARRPGGRAATGEVGSMERVRSVLDEARVVFRGLVRAPVFTLFAVGTVGLGVGATATVFTVLDRVVLRPLPYPDAGRLFVVGSEFSHDRGGLGPLSPAQLSDLILNPGPAEVVVGVSPGPATITRLGDPERLVVNRVSTGFFELLGATAHQGRLLNEQDQRLNAESVAVLDHGFWLERFGGDPDVMGASAGRGRRESPGRRCPGRRLRASGERGG